MTRFLQYITFSSLILSGVAMATEEPEFTVESKNDFYETRKYGPTLVAETKIESDFNAAGNKAFSILAGYIFGDNKSKTKIAMTAPVTQQSPSEKIAMTAPVSQVKGKDGFLIQFTMPKEYTLETLPTPNDARVVIRKLPARRVAVYGYSGSWSESKYKDKLAAFQAELSKQGVQTVGEPVFARFDSPFRLWFLRRNEIWLELK